MKNRKIRRFNKEKAGVIISSLLIVTACTVTGVYINGKEKEAEKNNVVDFAALEDGSLADENELAKNVNTKDETKNGTEEANSGEADSVEFDSLALDQDLDSDPFYEETNSDSIINQGLTANNGENNTTGTNGDNATNAAGESNTTGTNGDNATDAAGENNTTGTDDDNATKQEDDNIIATEGNDTTTEDSNKTDTEDATGAEAASQETMASAAFHEDAKLLWPVSGEVLMNYSMDKTIHFATLNQYKYNPALIIQSEVGTDVKAPAKATVKEIGQDSEIGQYIVMDLGGGYELTIGQLANITVSKDSSVSEGTVLGSVAEPSKYYSIEGSNVYMKLTKDGSSVNPMNFLN